MKYRTIVVDPPWKYEQGLSSSPLTRGSAEKIYPVMTDEQILAIPIPEWADTDCQLWLWVTNSHLHRGFHCLEHWGFTYKTVLTWAKTQIGLGYWLRGKTEHCLLGTRGNPRAKFVNTKHEAAGMAHSTLLTAQRGKHSEKPQAFYDMIEEIGEPPYLDVFNRRTRLGWDAIGDEVGVKIPPGVEKRLQ